VLGLIFLKYISDAFEAKHAEFDAERVFAGLTYTVPDRRFPYPEGRFTTVGLLSGRMVIVVWSRPETAGALCR
jgi:uncharacterized DUF497 family protein